MYEIDNAAKNSIYKSFENNDGISKNLFIEKKLNYLFEEKDIFNAKDKEILSILSDYFDFT